MISYGKKKHNSLSTLTMNAHLISDFVVYAFSLYYNDRVTLFLYVQSSTSLDIDTPDRVAAKLAAFSIHGFYHMHLIFQLFLLAIAVMCRRFGWELFHGLATCRPKCVLGGACPSQGATPRVGWA